MLSKEENEALTRVGRGTMMVNLFRRFWLPARLLSEVPDPDGAPIRLRILGEDLVAFRNSSGKLGSSKASVRTVARPCSSAAMKRTDCAAPIMAGS